VPGGGVQDRGMDAIAAQVRTEGAHLRRLAARLAPALPISAISGESSTSATRPTADRGGWQTAHRPRALTASLAWARFPYPIRTRREIAFTSVQRFEARRTEKAPFAEPFEKRMMGLEPTTFCMAIGRSWSR
jgi:hypothetical protein